jgi:hypothetical protein
MRREGICQKCGKVCIVQDHHIHGYFDKHKDEIVPYCRSCDRKAHDKARNEGKCKLSPIEVKKISTSSYYRRTPRIIFEETPGEFTKLVEQIRTYPGHDIIKIYTFFQATHRRKLIFEDI